MAAGPSRGAIQYVPALDGLRAFAILLVLWFHAGELFGREGVLIAGRGGWMGVDLFFVVSGYLITSILLETRSRSRSLRTFWLRRAVRIFPLHYLYLVVLVGVSLAAPAVLDARDHPKTVLEWLPYFLYLGNVAILLQGQVGHALILLWSLAIEEQFYAVWPVVTSKLDLRELRRLCLMGAAAALAFRFGAHVGLERQREFYYYLTFCRMDPLLLGAALAITVLDDTGRAKVTQWANRLIVPALVSVAVLLAICVGHIDARPSLWWITLGLTAVSLSMTVIVAWALDPPPLARQFLSLRPLVAIGRISYGIYIWHVLIGLGLTHWAKEAQPDWSATELVPLWLVLSLGISSGSWFLYEKPFLQLKRRFGYASSGA